MFESNKVDLDDSNDYVRTKRSALVRTLKKNHQRNLQRNAKIQAEQPRDDVFRIISDNIITPGLTSSLSGKHVILSPSMYLIFIYTTYLYV